MAKITGLARSTINRGEKDLDGRPLPKGRVRRGGGGRRALCENDPGLIPALKASRRTGKRLRPRLARLSLGFRHTPERA